MCEILRSLVYLSIFVLLAGCGEGEIQVVTGSNGDGSRDGGEFVRTDPHTDLRPDDWSVDDPIQENVTRETRVWEPRKSLNPNRAATEIEAGNDSEIIIDYGVWWDSSADAAPDKSQRRLYVFINFRPVGFYMYRYESNGGNEVNVTNYLKGNEIKSEATKSQIHSFDLEKDQEKVYSILIPQSEIERRLNDLRIVTVRENQHDLDRLFSEERAWAMRLTHNGREARNEDYATDLPGLARTVHPAKGIRYVLDSNRLFVASKGRRTLDFPVPEGAFTLEPSGDIETWVTGSPEPEEERVAVSIVHEGSLVGKSPFIGKIPQFSESWARESGEKYAVRFPISAGSQKGILRVFGFLNPLGDARLVGGRVHVSNALLVE